MIIGYQIKRKLEKIFKRTLICADTFDHLVEKN